jgi:tetratricopeptide (TPR) repeat protein
MTILEIYNKVYSTKETISLDGLIGLFEDNMALFENQIPYTDEEYNAVMRLTSDYAHNLKNKEAYSKSLPYLDKAIDLFDNYKGFDKSKMNDIEFYRILRFDRGVANYYLKNYLKSENDFTWLTKNNPDNDIFKNWIFSLRFRKYDQLLKILWYSIAASILFGTFIDKIKYPFIYNLILYLGALALIMAIVFEAIKQINKRKQKSYKKNNVNCFIPKDKFTIW